MLDEPKLKVVPDEQFGPLPVEPPLSTSTVRPLIVMALGTAAGDVLTAAAVHDGAAVGTADWSASRRLLASATIHSRRCFETASPEAKMSS